MRPQLLRTRQRLPETPIQAGLQTGKGPGTQPGGAPGLISARLVLGIQAEEEDIPRAPSGGDQEREPANPELSRVGSWGVSLVRSGVQAPQKRHSNAACCLLARRRPADGGGGLPRGSARPRVSTSCFLRVDSWPRSHCPHASPAAGPLAPRGCRETGPGARGVQPASCGPCARGPVLTCSLALRVAICGASEGRECGA